MKPFPVALSDDLLLERIDCAAPTGRVVYQFARHGSFEAVAQSHGGIRSVEMSAGLERLLMQCMADRPQVVKDLVRLTFGRIDEWHTLATEGSGNGTD